MAANVKYCWGKRPAKSRKKNVSKVNDTKASTIRRIRSFIRFKD